MKLLQLLALGSKIVLAQDYVFDGNLDVQAFMSGMLTAEQRDNVIIYSLLNTQTQIYESDKTVKVVC